MRAQSPTLAVERRHALLQHLAVWVGLLCLCAQFSSALHEVLVEHVHCAEHGERVHAGSIQHANHGDANDREDSSRGSAISASSNDDDHGHDHCLICAEQRELVLPPAAVPEQFARPGGDAPWTLRPDASLHTPRIYSFAPKTSPPV